MLLKFRLRIETHGSDSAEIVTSEGNKVVLTYEPFRLDVYIGKKDLVVSINSQGLLKFEHYRQKPGFVLKSQSFPFYIFRTPFILSLITKLS